MVIYADETFYNETYLAGKAAVITTAYTYYFREASRIIDVYTYNNIDPDSVPEEVKMCCCELAEQACKYDTAQSQSFGKNSESVQGWSVSYDSAAAQNEAQTNAQKDIIYKWLSGSGLLFSGVR